MKSQVSYSGWLPGGDRISRTPPPTLQSVLGRRSETSRPFGPPGSGWVYPPPLAQRRPGATRAPGLLSEAREVSGPLVFSQTGYNAGRRPAGTGPSPRPSAKGAGSPTRLVQSFPLRSQSVSNRPQPTPLCPDPSGGERTPCFRTRIYCATPDPLGNKATLQFPGLA